MSSYDIKNSLGETFELYTREYGKKYSGLFRGHFQRDMNLMENEPTN